MSGEIAAGAVEHPSITAMVAAGTVEVVAEGASDTQRGTASGKPGRMARQARPSSTGGHRSGDR